MSEPISFPGSTPNVGLPLLVPGQAQKEFFVNQALCLLDALQPRAVKASQAVPPASPSEGECYRVTAPAIGAWLGREDCVAIWIAGDWQFIAPLAGMNVFDRSASHVIVYRSEWKRGEAPLLATGGNVVDAEARAAIGALVDGLKSIGLLATADP